MSTTATPVTTAKAVRITAEFGIANLTFNEVEVMQPGPGQVLVAIKACSLNYRDLLMVKGHYNPRLKRPMTICSDGAGEVIATGEGVTRFKAGDRVAGAFFQKWIAGPLTREGGDSALGGAIDGVLTTYRTFDEEGLVHIPGHLDYREGATLPCAAVTAWNTLVETAHVRAGDTVVLLGTGGVSIFALQFAKMNGARVIITSSSDEKLRRARDMGADDTINYKNTPDWEKEVSKLTGKRGADIVVEVGGAGTLPRSLKAVRPAGFVGLIGVLSGIEQPMNIGPILHNNVHLQGIYVGSVEMFENMNRAITQHKMKPVIDLVFGYEQTREALHHMESGQHFGKIVIDVNR